MRKRNYLRAARGSSLETHKRHVLLLVAAIAGIYFLSSFIFGEMGLVKYYRMKQQHDSLQEETGRLKEENVRLLRDVRALKSDPALIEQIARDKLGLARPGEIVYYYGKQEP